MSLENLKDSDEEYISSFSISLANIYVHLQSEKSQKAIKTIARENRAWEIRANAIDPFFSLQLNVHQRSLEAASIELCGAGGSVPQGQPSSAGSVGSAPSPASPRPTPQSRPPLSATTSQPSRTLDDDRSTDGERIFKSLQDAPVLVPSYVIKRDRFAGVGAATTNEDSDDGESRAQYVNANCVVFTHYRGDAASEVEEHFQRALAHDKLKGESLDYRDSDQA